VVRFADPIRCAPQAHALLATVEIPGLIVLVFTFLYRVRKAALSAGYRNLFFAVLSSGAASLAKSTLRVSRRYVAWKSIEVRIALLALLHHLATPPLLGERRDRGPPLDVGS